MTFVIGVVAIVIVIRFCRVDFHGVGVNRSLFRTDLVFTFRFARFGLVTPTFLPRFFVSSASVVRSRLIICQWFVSAGATGGRLFRHRLLTFCGEFERVRSSLTLFSHAVGLRRRFLVKDFLAFRNGRSDFIRRRVLVFQPSGLASYCLKRERVLSVRHLVPGLSVNVHVHMFRVTVLDQARVRVSRDGRVANFRYVSAVHFVQFLYVGERGGREWTGGGTWGVFRVR